MRTLKQLSWVAALALVFGASLGAEIIEQVLVKVNGDIFTKTELEERQVQYLRQQNQQYSDEELKEVLAKVTPQILANTIDEMLLVQRGRELGYRLSDQQFKEILERIKKENNITSEEQFQAALDQEGLTIDDLRRTLERQALIARVQQVEIMRTLSITEVEVRQYYDAHPQEFATKPTITLREILIEVPGDARGVNVALDDEAREKAEAARARVVAGEDFAKVAGEISTAPSRANGGLIGPVNRSEVSAAVIEVVDKLKPGEVSAVLRTQRGYQLLKLEAVADAAAPPFDQVRDQVAERVGMQRRQVELEKYVKKLREQAVIDWKNQDLKKAYDQYLASETAGGVPSP